MKKAQQEEIFVTHIKEIGIKSYSKMYDHGNWYWAFTLKNGERRYWTNLSPRGMAELGIKDK